jgi:hypothetical protein
MAAEVQVGQRELEAALSSLNNNSPIGGSELSVWQTLSAGCGHSSLSSYSQLTTPANPFVVISEKSATARPALPHSVFTIFIPSL